MYRIKGRIQGVAPLLYNRLTEEALEGVATGKTGGHFTVEQRREQAMQKVHKNGLGLYIPGWNFKQCFLEGCSRARLKEGRFGLSRFLAATVFVEGDLLFGKEEIDFLHEHWGRIPPGPRGKAVIVRRPAMDTGWELPFTLMVVDDRRNAEQIRISIEEAGMLVGLGSWRPEYGRFILTEWEVLKDK